MYLLILLEENEIFFLFFHGRVNSLFYPEVNWRNDKRMGEGDVVRQLAEEKEKLCFFLLFFY